MLALAAVTLTFGLARLQLKFSLDNLRQETQRLQDERIELGGGVNRLQGRIEQNKHPERILSIAEDQLRMVRNSQFDFERVLVSYDALDRFSNTRLAELQRTGPTQETPQNGFALALAIAERLGYVEPAFAETSERQSPT